jgi:hypothetical protein
LASEFLIAGRANQKITLRAESTDDIKTPAQHRAVHARALFDILDNDASARVLAVEKVASHIRSAHSDGLN